MVREVPVAQAEGGLCPTLSAARIGDTAQPARRRATTVTIEEASPAERLAVFARAHALSPRESVLLGHLAKGADSHAPADRMSLAEHTVQDHLKPIFATTSTHNRGMLLARALGA